KSDSEEIENFLHGDSIPIGVEDSPFNMEEDILFLEGLLSEDPLPMIPNQTKSSIKEPEHSFSIGYEHFSTTLIDNLNEFSGPFIPIHIAEEERIRREHADYINRMEMLFTINPRPHPTLNANTNVESLPSLPIPVQDNDSQREEIDIITSSDEVLPPGVENDDSDGEVDDVVSLPPPEPPDEELDFEIDFEDEILVVRNTIAEFECIDAGVKFDVSNDENDDLSYFMFVIFVKVFSLLSVESEDTIFDLGISV
nr:hypothetical protein [Tanacetum cinerariifolium]